MSLAAGRAAALAILLGLALGGCNFNLPPKEEESTPAPAPPTDFLAQSQCGTVSYTSAAPLEFSTTFPAGQVSFITSAAGFTTVTASIPEAALSVGVVVRGPDANLQFLDHGVLVLSETPNCLTTPGGRPAPLAFNLINLDQDDDEDIDQDLLYDRQTTALFYPNDGSVLALPAGAYSFPVASANLGGVLTSALVDVDVYYKIAASQPSDVRVNLWVVQGTGGGAGLQTQDDLINDPGLNLAEIVLSNVYGNSVGLNLTLTRILLADAPELLLIETDEELDSLYAGYPSPAENNALNVFVVDDIALPGLSTGVIGLASRIPGPFNLDGTSKSGIVVVYLGSGTQLGYAIAHELGHYLGLYHTSQPYLSRIIGHDPVDDTLECDDSDLDGTVDFGKCPDVENLMFPFISNTSDPLVSEGQVNVIRLNPAISTP